MENCFSKKLQFGLKIFATTINLDLNCFESKFQSTCYCINLSKIYFACDVGFCVFLFVELGIKKSISLFVTVFLYNIFWADLSDWRITMQNDKKLV